MRDLDDLFASLERSAFRRRFRLGSHERAYLKAKTLPVVVDHARQFLVERLADAKPTSDGRQTPMHGHPVFIAQHATATCCRGCLAKWHHIAKGRPLAEDEIQYLVDVIERWLRGALEPAELSAKLPPAEPLAPQRWLFDEDESPGG